jgi:hypothetical protein
MPRKKPGRGRHERGDEIDDSSAPLIEHLAELRSRLIKAAMAFIVAMVLCFTVWNPIFNFLTEPLCSAMAARGPRGLRAHPDPAAGRASSSRSRSRSWAGSRCPSR